MSEILKIYPDCRSDLIGGGATQTFAPGSKQPLAATVQQSNNTHSIREQDSEAEIMCLLLP